jgi:hypothetical protein
MRVVAGHAEHGRDLGDLKALPQLQFDDLPLAGIQAFGGICEQDAQPCAFGILAYAGVIAGRARHRVNRRRDFPGPQDPQAFVPRDRVQPGAQPLGVTQPGEPGRGDDERVLHRVRGVGRVAEHGPAVLVERICVPVVGPGEPVRVAGHDGRDDLTVPHIPTVADHVLNVAALFYSGSDKTLACPTPPGPKLSGLADKYRPLVPVLRGIILHLEAPLDRDVKHTASRIQARRHLVMDGSRPRPGEHEYGHDQPADDR